MTPQQYCQDIAKQSHSSFYHSFFFLPKKKKEAMIALYAFCRVVDDIVDLTHEPQIAATKLTWWAHEIDLLYQDKPQHPITRALHESVKNYQLPQQAFQDILLGMQMDLTQHRYENFDDLYIYCYRVASTVGILTAHILGFRNPNTLIYAEKLGIALQLVNIIRDVGQDALRKRIYLPQDELNKLGITSQEIMQLNFNESMQNCLKNIGKRARQYYCEAIQNLPKIDARSQKVGLVMANIYFELLNQIEQCGYDTLRQRVQLTSIHQLWVALKAWFYPQPRICL